ncbi:MAG: hypothetical protein R3E84_04745 [Pseudomonadales bacterium]
MRAGRQTSLRPPLLRACHRDPGLGIRRSFDGHLCAYATRTGKLLWTSTPTTTQFLGIPDIALGEQRANAEG